MADIPTQQWKLLEVLFDGCGTPRGLVKDDEVIEHVYGHDADDCEGALDALRGRLNILLGKRGAGTVERPRTAGGLQYKPPASR